MVYEIVLSYVRIVFLIPNGSMHLLTINTMSAFWNLMVHSFNFVEINLATKAIFSKIKHNLQKVIIFYSWSLCLPWLDNYFLSYLLTWKDHACFKIPFFCVCVWILFLHPLEHSQTNKKAKVNQVKMYKFIVPVKQT